MLLKHSKAIKEVSRFVYLFFIGFLFLLTLPAPAQSPQENPQLSVAYHHILALRIEMGRESLNGFDGDEEENALALYTLNLGDVLELLLIEDLQRYDQIKHLEKERLATLNQFSPDSPWKKFCEAEIRLQWAFVKIKYGDELSAVWNFNQSYKAHLANLNQFPDFVPNQKTAGIFNIIFGAVPQKHQWLLRFFSMNGSTEDGMAALESLAGTSDVFSLESRILLLLADAYLMDNAGSAIEELTALAKVEKENKLLKYLLAITLLKNNQAEKALEALQAVGDLEKGYAEIAYAEYLKGEIMLQTGNYKQASALYASFILNYKGLNFVKDAYYKIFLANYLEGDEKDASFFLEKAKTNGTTITEADKYAEKQISSGTNPNREILKIRLATDGGFYTRADSLIQRSSMNDFDLLKDKVEFVYRKARLFDKIKESEKAIEQYKLTLEKAGNNNWYFAPNAALQLGYLYADKGQKATAKFYFEKALSYRDYEYKNSIDHKAKAALQKIN